MMIGTLSCFENHHAAYSVHDEERIMVWAGWCAWDGVYAAMMGNSLVELSECGAKVTCLRC